MSFGVAMVVIVLAVIGHLVILRAALNHGYEMGLPQRLWQGLVLLILATAAGGAIVIVRNVGLRGPALLRGGSWGEVPLGWQLYIGFCIASLLVGALVLWLRARDAVVPAQVAMQSDVRDFREVNGRAAIGPGPVAALARLPGNQVFTVEIIERQIRMPRMPRQFDGLSILHITDLHMNGTPGRDYFEWAAERCAEQRADLIAMTGDMMDHLGVMEWLPTTLGKLDAPMGKYFVLGNHDLHVGGDEMRAAMEALGWQSVAGRIVEQPLRDGRLIIGGSERPWAGGDPPIDGELRPNDFRILLSHAPHLVHWAKRRHVDLVLAGHLHGGQIQWPLIGPVAGGRLHSGLFDLHPTILHVGRGLGQMAPVRWGCRPEITKLILRAPAERLGSSS